MSQSVVMEPLKTPERFITQANIDLDDELARVAAKVDHLARRIKDPTTTYPAEFTVDGQYPLRDNRGWTEGFWPGMNWLLVEAEVGNKYAKTAHAADLGFVQRVQTRSHVNTHDLGFLYSLSTVAEYRLTGDEQMRQAGLDAATLLMQRYWPKAGIIQAWGDPNDPTQQGRMILDCCLNLPLLYWASETSGDHQYIDAARQHAQQAARYLVRADASTYHTYYMDIETGAPKYGSTHQGYSDDSCWARGQAWGVYGFALAAKYLHEPAYFELSLKLLHYFLNRQPNDLVSYWDLIFQEPSDQARDSSSTAIVVCGILEMLSQHRFTDAQQARYTYVAQALMQALVKHYRTDAIEEGFITAGVYNHNKHNGIGVPMIWGDYFYLEALVRMRGQWQTLW